MNGIHGLILVTGGTGSLGHALVGRAEAEGWDASFVVYSRDEAKQAAMRARFPDGVRYVLGDVRDEPTLEEAAHGADVIVHAAAQKRVPEAERQPITCAQSNVEGSAQVVHVARRLGTPRVIGISTDKACSPVNAYGMTKALMERMFQAEALEHPAGPAFTLVRYGNVLASTGSVVPAFRAQAASGMLQLTDPGMTRFWLSLDDAVDLIMAALGLDAGEILIPRSRASSMAVMAEAVAPGVPTRTTGNRGGEKRHEQLLSAHEAPYAVETPAGFVLSPLTGPPAGFLPEGFEYRSDTAPAYTADELRAVLARMDAHESVRTLGAAA